MTVYCWIATIICLTGTALNVKRINFCFTLWVIGEIMWVIYDLQSSLYSRTILDAIGLFFAVLGIYENQIKVKNKK